MAETAPLPVVEAGFRAMAKVVYADAGGDPEAFAALRRAYAEARMGRQTGAAA